MAIILEIRNSKFGTYIKGFTHPYNSMRERSFSFLFKTT